MSIVQRCRVCEKKKFFLSLNETNLCFECAKVVAGIPQDYVVLDLETTGLNPKKDEILEIGAIKYRNHVEIDRFHTYVHPKKAIPYAATAVNGITWEAVLHAPSIDDVRPDLKSFIDEETIVGYNVDFDSRFLLFQCSLAPVTPRYDVLSTARQLLKNEPSYKLDCLRQRYDLGGDAHSSIGDCEATARLIRLFVGV